MQVAQYKILQDLQNFKNKPGISQGFFTSFLFYYTTIPLLFGIL